MKPIKYIFKVGGYRLMDLNGKRETDMIYQARVASHRVLGNDDPIGPIPRRRFYRNGFVIRSRLWRRELVFGVDSYPGLVRFSFPENPDRKQQATITIDIRRAAFREIGAAGWIIGFVREIIENTDDNWMILEEFPIFEKEGQRRRS